MNVQDLSDAELNALLQSTPGATPAETAQLSPSAQAGLRAVKPGDTNAQVQILLGEYRDNLALPESLGKTRNLGALNTELKRAGFTGALPTVGTPAPAADLKGLSNGELNTLANASAPEDSLEGSAKAAGSGVTAGLSSTLGLPGDAAKIMKSPSSPFSSPAIQSLPSMQVFNQLPSGSELYNASHADYTPQTGLEKYIKSGTGSAAAMVSKSPILNVVAGLMGMGGEAASQTMGDDWRVPGELGTLFAPLGMKGAAVAGLSTLKGGVVARFMAKEIQRMLLEKAPANDAVLNGLGEEKGNAIADRLSAPGRLPASVGVQARTEGDNADPTTPPPSKQQTVTDGEYAPDKNSLLLGIVEALRKMHDTPGRHAAGKITQ